ncbi:hypothetical protein [Dermatobacter hominis]|uniref:hypothetical protein n=1 Tax=Dermatobacter hominis TaxID=2884263 RepID=UPI001D1293C9|nr:hypothetical protein [Dermatobacter hominis]UDY34753.1 hypothetical protein LH044_15595 [Dermatobacter hominis]
MSRRRTLFLPLIALMAVFALVAGACGGDDKADDEAGSKKKTTTTTEKATDTTEEGDVTTTTVSDADFETAVDEAKTQLAEAGDDPCKVIEQFRTLGTSIANPSNAAQREQATGLAVAFYLALADAAPAELSAEADQIRATVEKIEDEGKEKGYTEEFLSKPESVDEAFNDNTNKILTAFTTQCGSTPSTAAP